MEEREDAGTKLEDRGSRVWSGLALRCGLDELHTQSRRFTHLGLRYPRLTRDGRPGVGKELRQPHQVEGDVLIAVPPLEPPANLCDRARIDEPTQRQRRSLRIQN